MPETHNRHIDNIGDISRCFRAFKNFVFHEKENQTHINVISEPER